MDNKTCIRCNQSKPATDFNYKGKEKIDLRAYCKECGRIYGRLRKRANPEIRRLERIRYNKANPDRIVRRRRRWAWKYKGLNPDEIERIMSNHNGLCDLCGNPFDKQSLVVDHCHNTKKFRGILCNRCNLGIGQFSDSQALLLKAVDYLKRFSQV